jgi:hypothetical protein
VLESKQLLKIVEEVNKEIPNQIEGLSSIESFQFESDGDTHIIKFSGGMYWTVEEEEIDSKEDFYRIMLERLDGHNVQVEGMVKWFKKELNMSDPQFVSKCGNCFNEKCPIGQGINVTNLVVSHCGDYLDEFDAKTGKKS